MEWLLFLLPVAAASGWWAAKRSGAGRGVSEPGPDPAFLRGLNYLLDEQPDKAIDVFLKLAEVDGETAETHLALGSLFRRRGEVDRAIRIHQNLVARPKLGKEQRGFALYELGQDYMRAGLFDRAESLFRELVEMKLHRERALQGLREIYQQEKDWLRCLEVAEQLQSHFGVPMGAEIAQYHCELAEEALKSGNRADAQVHLRQAQSASAQCVRATMLQAQLEVGGGDPEAAVSLYRRVAHQGPQFIPEILPDLLDALRRSGRTDPRAELEDLYRSCPSPALALTIAEEIQRAEGDAAVVAFLVDYLSRHADLAVLERLLEVDGRASGGAPARATRRAILGVIQHLRSRQPDYQCAHCGFVARRLHWQCPSCKHWGTIQPLPPQSMAQDPESLPDRRIA